MSSKSKNHKFAQVTKDLADHVGGRQGRALSKAVVAAMSRPSVGSRTLVGPQMDAVRGFLGGYTPDAVPIAVKRRMRKHAQVRYCLGAAKAPILRGDVWFDTNSTELDALLTRVFIDSGFFKRALRTSLLAVEFGFSAHEQIWDIEENMSVGWEVPNTSGGLDRRTAHYPQLFYPKNLKSLDPSMVTILMDKFGDKRGLLYGGAGRPVIFTEEQLKEALASGRYNVLDAKKSFVYTLDGDFGDPYGCGRLDSAYDPWYWQGIVFLICNRWFEKKADPPLIGYAPSTSAIADPGVNGTEYDPEDENEAPVLLMASALRKLRSTGEVVFPSDPYFDESGKPSNIRAYSAEEMGTKDMHPAFLEYIEHLDRKISRAVMVPDSITASQSGMSQYGSLQVMADVYVDVQNDTLYSAVEQINAEVIQPFLRYNGLKDRAILRTGGISAANRETSKDIFLKVLEADMLAEQAFGRVYPQSLTAMLDREKLARAQGVPFKRPDPDAPAPKMPQTIDPGAGGGAAPGAAGQPPRGPAKKVAPK